MASDSQKPTLSSPAAETDGVSAGVDTAAQSEGVFFSRRAMAGMPWAVANNFVLFFVFFATTAFLTRYLTLDEFGLFGISITVMEFAVVVCALGLNAGILRFVPELLLHNNRAGLRRLLTRTALLQFAVAALLTAALIAAQPVLARHLTIDSTLLVLFIGLLIAARTFKNYVDDALIALFQTRLMSILSVGQGLTRLALVVILVWLWPTAEMAVNTYTISMVLFAVLGAIVIAREVRRLPGPSPELGIGRKRVLRLGMPRLFNTLLVKMTGEFTETFFILYYFGKGAVAVYWLAYRVPLMFMTTVPTAVQRIYNSAMAEAYTKDPKSIERLVESFYKVLIALMLPIGIFGAFFAPTFMEIVYQPSDPNTGLYCSLLFIYHSVTLISLPFGAVVITREKIHLMTPMLIVQVTLNILLDWLLIPRYGIPGALAALFSTYLLTTPIRLYIVYRILGGMPFPWLYFLRITLTLAALAYALRLLFPNDHLTGFLAASALFGLVYVAAIRYAHLIRPEDIADFRQLRFGKLNRLFDILVPTPSART